MTTAMNRGLTVLIADEREEALEPLGSALSELGHDPTPYAVSVAEASELIAREEPDLAIVVVHQDDEHALALISEAVEFAPGPVIVYAADGDVDFVTRAAEHGVSAYVQSLSAEAVQGAIEVALRRHSEKAALSAKVEQLENALARRGLIERAKGILMERHGVDERAAFALLRDHARSQNRRVIDLAGSVVEGHGLLPKG
jgi:AmiR/NasT family two-component response regulator